MTKLLRFLPAPRASESFFPNLSHSSLSHRLLVGQPLGHSRLQRSAASGSPPRTSGMPRSLLSERDGLPREELVLGPRYSRTSELLRRLKSHQKPMALAPKKAQVGPTDHPQVPEHRPAGASPKRFSLNPPLPSGLFPNPADSSGPSPSK